MKTDSPELGAAFSHRIILYAVAVLIALSQVWISIGDQSFLNSRTLPRAYDALSMNLLKGSAEVGGSIQFEKMVRNGRSYMYFGPFPAIVRIIPNLVFPEYYGKWGYLSFLFAAVLLLYFLTRSTVVCIDQGVVGTDRATQICIILIGVLGLISFCLGFELYLLCRRTIYNEAIIWALAGTIGSLYYTFRYFLLDDDSHTNFLCLSSCSGIALLSRVMYGVSSGLLVGVVLLVVLYRYWNATSSRFKQSLELSRLFALCAPGLLCLCFQFWYNVARFDSLFIFYSLDMYEQGKKLTGIFSPVNEHGFFAFKRMPYAVSTYFLNFDLPATDSFPYFQARGIGTHEFFVRLQARIVPLSLCAAFLLLGGITGVWEAIRKREVFVWLIAGVLAPQFIMILCFNTLYQRYMFELLPLPFAFYFFWLANFQTHSRFRQFGIVLTMVIVSVVSLVSSYALLLASAL